MRATVIFVMTMAVAASAAQAPTPAGRPNVVLIITDDVGYGDFGAFGAPDIKTPNIDSLAKAGTRFTDFYAAPTCSPTRAALISGRYQQRARIERPLPASVQAPEQGLRPTGRSLPQLLKSNGYATALIGKWHLGYRPEFSPIAHGFDYFFGFKSGLIDYYQHTDQNGKDDLFENDAPVQVTGYMTDLITQRSVNFIEQNKARPFFLEVAYNAAHWPFQVPDMPSVAPDNARFVQPHDEHTSTRRDYVAIVERADRGIGEVLQALERNGLTRNTLVIFTNDNGGEWLSRNAPLFHRKDTLWEGGIRVPAIMRWPGRVPAGWTTSQPAIVLDLTATILAATGTTVPADAKLDGTNLLPAIERRTTAAERPFFFRISTPGRQQRAVRRGDWKLLIDGDDTLLFQLPRDIGERNDVAQQHPEIVRELRSLLQAWERDVDADAKEQQSGRSTAGAAR